MKNLILGYTPFTITPAAINESLNKNHGKLIVSGVIQRAGAMNQNSRVYPRPILEREDSFYQELIKQRKALGELDHPDSSIINLANVSHNIIETWWKDNDLYGKIEILSTPSGNILKELLSSNITLGISSRGLGSVKEIQIEGSKDQYAYEIQEDYELICYDFVSNPSTHGAYMNPITENTIKEIKENRHLFNVNVIINEILSDISKIK